MHRILCCRSSLIECTCLLSFLTSFICMPQFVCSELNSNWNEITQEKWKRSEAFKTNFRYVWVLRFRAAPNLITTFNFVETSTCNTLIKRRRKYWNFVQALHCIGIWHLAHANRTFSPLRFERAKINPLDFALAETRTERWRNQWQRHVSFCGAETLIRESLVCTRSGRCCRRWCQATT